ncbi:MAG: SRPBCC family protein, partial [Candidatus Omnitrophica bacterium]|nr:SRPBCC family protein [Candidatus Omnitrophota bacterium]
MVEEKPAEIFVKRVVHGPKWKVVRLLTKIWEFPEYMVNVKQAKVLSKQHNIWRTEWLIKVEKVLITWIQEDKLELRRNKITFCLVEGDLKEFSGQWQFNDHPDGTEVTLTVAAKVGIPAIHSFASNYIKDLMTKNFEGILEAIDERIIAARYSEFKKGSIDAVSGFAVIGHFYNLYHLEKCFKMLHPDFKMPSQAFLSSLFHTTPPFKLHDINDFKSKTGETANGRFIVATFIPEMVEQDIWTVFSKVVKSCKIAEQFGVGIVSLGGFTSIVGERIGQEIKDQVNVAVTTGNTFTA